ncbi:hypothetical protein KGM_216002 [Danaus plexippus plexippus]|uniref:Uncharacterized protein n=1 Tax=Danaus plexippus plexippus TaxID=278856 RepID=A0A212ELV3_DANPL|nr:hypothetical protein KGM_216002 [Danaus plexippus plexippus]
MDSKGGDANNAVDVYPKCSSVGFIDSDVNKMYMALTAITREIQSKASHILKRKTRLGIEKQYSS